MAHQIFGERFVTYKKPAWHALGLVTQEEMSAREAFLAAGQLQVQLYPVAIPTLDNLPTGKVAIVRHPTHDDPEYRILDVVSQDYTLITPWEFVNLYDERVAKPIETLGVLKRGEVIFITTKLPTMDVKGDEVENYLICVSPMTGTNAAELRVSHVRVVCANTLQASAQQSSESYRLVHDPTIKTRLGDWMQQIYEAAEQRVGAIKETMELLASYRLYHQQVKEIVNASYPLREAPADIAPDDVVTERTARWEARRETLEKRKKAVMDLFRGAGTGMESEACKGTAWGLYNAVCEVEDYRRGRGLASIAQEAMFGRRLDTKVRAYEACVEVVRRNIK